jgi:hypothetical protein
VARSRRAANDRILRSRDSIPARRVRSGRDCARCRRSGASRHEPRPGDRHARERCAARRAAGRYPGSACGRTACAGGGPRAESGGGSGPRSGGRCRRSGGGRRRRGHGAGQDHRARCRATYPRRTHHLFRIRSDRDLGNERGRAQVHRQGCARPAARHRLRSGSDSRPASRGERRQRHERHRPLRRGALGVRPHAVPDGARRRRHAPGRRCSTSSRTCSAGSGCPTPRPTPSFFPM